MSIFSKLFGGKSNASPDPSEVYKDMRITATPLAEGKSYRLAARIECDLDGETLTHQLVRADTFQDRDQAAAAAIAKARQVIDEQGRALFG